jgi:hypothetical protein
MLNRDLMTGLKLEILILTTGREKREDAEDTMDHVVLIGDSHLKRTLPYLCR